jgi:hypothetical protein
VTAEAPPWATDILPLQLLELHTTCQAAFAAAENLPITAHNAQLYVHIHFKTAPHVLSPYKHRQAQTITKKTLRKAKRGL